MKRNHDDSYESHRLADIFPLLQGQAFEELTDDIRQHGQREDIVLFQRKILDGRNRYAACRAAGVEPRFKNYEGNESARIRHQHEP